MHASNRIAMSLDEQKSIMLNILVQFASFCQTHKLNYFLDAGTLLGAVRHHGFIPWDDDIDVNMPRTDYDRFCHLAKKNGGYIAEHLFVEFSEDTIFPFLKIADDRTLLIEYPDTNPMEVSVYIDVFPKDGIKDSGIGTKMVCQISYWLNLWRWFNVFSVDAWRKSHNAVKRFMAFCGRKFTKEPNLPLRLQQKWLRRNAKLHPLEKCQYVTTLVNGEFHKRAPKECFADYMLMDFENKQFRVPIGYDMYLRCLYPGDYMQLPPIEKRTVHNTQVFWRSSDAKNDFENLME